MLKEGLYSHLLIRGELHVLVYEDPNKPQLGNGFTRNGDECILCLGSL